MRDRSLGVTYKEEAPNHPELRPKRATVVSVKTFKGDATFSGCFVGDWLSGTGTFLNTEKEPFPVVDVGMLVFLRTGRILLICRWPLGR